MTRDDEKGADYAHRVHDGTRRFAQDLLAENERLRKLAATLQSEKLLLEDQLLAMKEEQFRHERERRRLERELAQIECESRRFSQKYLEVERQSSNLANLYVAAYQLHATLDRETVLGAIQEIIANLVGSEHVGIFERLDDGSLSLVASNGIDAARWRRVPSGRGWIGRCVELGQVFLACTATPSDGPADAAEEHMTACIPLTVDGAVIGAIAIFQLLPQKAGLEEVDKELFGLLATHAATALYCAVPRPQLRARA